MVCCTSTTRLDGQYALVKQETNKSHVSEYGSVGTFDKTEHVHDFQGHGSSSDAGGGSMMIHDELSERGERRTRAPSPSSPPPSSSAASAAAGVSPHTSGFPPNPPPTLFPRSPK